MPHEFLSTSLPCRWGWTQCLPSHKNGSAHAGLKTLWAADRRNVGPRSSQYPQQDDSTSITERPKISTASAEDPAPTRKRPNEHQPIDPTPQHLLTPCPFSMPMLLFAFSRLPPCPPLPSVKLAHRFGEGVLRKSDIVEIVWRGWEPGAQSTTLGCLVAAAP